MESWEDMTELEEQMKRLRPASRDLKPLPRCVAPREIASGTLRPLRSRAVDGPWPMSYFVAGVVPLPYEATDTARHQPDPSSERPFGMRPCTPWAGGTAVRESRSTGTYHLRRAGWRCVREREREWDAERP